MKHLIQSMVAIVTVSAMLHSCKKADIAPNENSTPTQSTRGGGVIANPRNHTLVKFGNDSIIFNGTGKILKLQDNAGGRTDFAYGPSSIYTVAYLGNSVDNEIQYLLDTAGRVTRTWHKTYPLVNGTPTLTETYWLFEYFPDGKLKKRYRGVSPGERQEFVYDPNGNLTEVRYFMTANGLAFKKIFLSYKSALNPKMRTDKLKLNFKYSGFNPHVKVFGTFSKYLPVNIVIQEMGQVVVNEEHYYTMDADGYPVKYDVFNKLTNQWGAPVQFRYQGEEVMNM